MGRSVKMTRKKSLASVMRSSHGWIATSLLSRRSLNTNRRSLKEFATPSSLNCTRVPVVLLAVCPVACLVDSQVLALVGPQVVLPREVLVDQPLRKLIKTGQLSPLLPPTELF